MQFPGAWIDTSETGVNISFATFDETELTPDSGWTEAWQNEDPSAPAGFVHPAMILAETGRRLLELRPDLAERVRALSASGDDTGDRKELVRAFEIRDAEQFGLLCLSLCESVVAMTRKHAPKTPPGMAEGINDEIPS